MELWPGINDILIRYLISVIKVLTVLILFCQTCISSGYLIKLIYRHMSELYWSCYRRSFDSFQLRMRFNPVLEICYGGRSSTKIEGRQSSYILVLF